MARVRLPWYKRDHREMLATFRRLGIELGGVLSAFVDLCCLEGGSVEDDDRYISGQFGIDIRQWKRIRRKLIDEGEIYEMYDPDTGRRSISSLRADEILRDSRKRVQNGRRAAKIGVEKRERKDADARVRSTTPALERPHTKGGIYDGVVNTNNDLDAAGAERASSDNRYRSRKEITGRSDLRCIGEILEESDMPIVIAASRRAGSK